MRTHLICMLLTAGLTGCMQPVEMASPQITHDEPGDPTAGRKLVEERCSSCHWDPIGRDKIAIAMGAVDKPTGTRLDKHIFVADKGDYYDIADGLPQNQR